MTQIGNALGTTRSGASGIVSRMRAKGEITTVPKPIRRTIKATETRRAMPSQPKPPSMPEPVEEPPCVVPWLTVETIRDGLCKYPHGDVGTAEFHFCGQPSLGILISWCPHHFRRISGRGTASERAAAKAVAG